MRSFILLSPFLALLLTLGCFEVDNSFDGGVVTPTPPPGSMTDAELRFVAAQAVIKAKCDSCHTGYHSTYDELSEDDWLDELSPAGLSLVSAGDLSSSYFWERITNDEMQLMPLGGSLSSDEKDAIQDWIEGIE